MLRLIPVTIILLAWMVCLPETMKAQEPKVQNSTPTVPTSGPDGKRQVILRKSQLDQVRQIFTKLGRTPLPKESINEGDFVALFVSPEEARLIAQAQLDPFTTKVSSPVSPLDLQTQELVNKFRAAKPSEQPAIRSELETVTARQFDQRHRQRLDELKDLEARLEKLKASVTRREQLKDDIVRQRVNDLLSVENPLRWDTEDAPALITTAPRGIPVPPPLQVAAPRIASILAVPSGHTDPLILPPAPRAMLFQGTILQVELNGDSEISVGAADGLKLGQQVDVHRSYQKNSAEISRLPSPPRYIGRLEIVALQSDRASCKPVPGTRTEFMVTGDQVSLNLEGAPKTAPLSGDLAALQGNWYQELSESADKNPDQVRPRECWTIDGKLFVATKNGQVKCRGIFSLGQTKTSKFIQIRDLEQFAISENGNFFAMYTADPKPSRSSCFLYRIQGEQLETQGFGIEKYSSPSSLPTEFGGEDSSGKAYVALVFRRAKETASPDGQPSKTPGPAKF